MMAQFLQTDRNLIYSIYNDTFIWITGRYQKEQAVQGRDSCWYKGADRADSESSFYVVTIYCYPTQDFLQILKKGGKYITL